MGRLFRFVCFMRAHMLEVLVYVIVKMYRHPT